MKKFTRLSLIGASLTLLAGCSGKAITRADAIVLLSNMDSAVNASSFVFPSKWGITKFTPSSLKEVRTFAKDSYFYGGKQGTLKEENSTSEHSAEGWAFVKDGQVTLAYNDGKKKVYAQAAYKGTGDNEKAATAAFANVQTAAYQQKDIIKEAPKDLKEDLSNYVAGTGKTAINSASGSDARYMKEELFTSVGEGFLYANFTTEVVSGTSDPEQMICQFSDNRISNLQDFKSGETMTFAWDNYSEAAFSATDYTDVGSDSASIVLLGVAILTLASPLSLD
jgi:hypothetical protein